MLGWGEIRTRIVRAFERPAGPSPNLALESFSPRDALSSRQLSGAIQQQIETILNGSADDNAALSTAYGMAKNALLALAAAPPAIDESLGELIRHFKIRQPLQRLVCDQAAAATLFDKLERRLKTVGDLAKLSYLRGRITPPAGQTASGQALEEGLGLLANRAAHGPYTGEILPMAVERFQRFLRRISVDLESAPPEIVRIVDECNMLYVRLALGQKNSGSPFCRSLSSLLSADNGTQGGDVKSRPLALEGSAKGNYKLDGQEVFDALLHAGGIKEGKTALTALSAACRAVFTSFPPLRTEKLYTLAACAMLAFENGVEGLELGPKSSGLSALEPVAVHMDKKRLNQRLIEWVAGCEAGDQLLLSFLLSQLSEEAGHKKRSF